MQLNTIDIDPELARAKVKEYRRAVKDAASTEDAAIARGYLHAAEGRPLIRLSKAIADGGLDENNRPRLAVARADQAWCYLDTSRSASGPMRARFVAAPFGDRRRAPGIVQERSWRGETSSGYVLGFDFPVEPITQATHPREVDEEWWAWDGRVCAPWRTPLGRGFRTQVPITPPGLRPTRGGLHLYHVLWEVEEWAQAPEPPGDPALIRQVAGDLWAVYGVWDLSELERAAIAGR